MKKRMVRAAAATLLLVASGCFGPTEPEQDGPKEDGDTPKREQPVVAAVVTSQVGA